MPGPTGQNTLLFHRISFPFEANPFRLVVIVNLVLMLILRLLICRLLLLPLPSLPDTSSNRPSACSNGRSFTGVAGNCSDSRPKQSSADRSTNRTSAICRLLLRGLLSLGWVVAGLLNCPLVTFEFILLLLFGTLPFCRIDHHSCIYIIGKCQSDPKKYGNGNTHRDTEKTDLKMKMFLSNL